MPFPPVKSRVEMPPADRCVFCERTTDAAGNSLRLTSEHVIPEFLGAGLELPNGTCDDCQRVTSAYEGTVAADIFDAVRRAFILRGKKGVFNRANLPVDLGGSITNNYIIPAMHHPTILVLPAFYPASSFSNRPHRTNGMFNLRIYNVNAVARLLRQYGIKKISTVHIDTVRFCQLIGKIAHVYAIGYLGQGAFTPLLSPFIHTNITPQQPFEEHYNNIGGLWTYKEIQTDALHEIEIGEISWQGETLLAARVRLFASYGMPSYFVAVGKPII